MRNLKSYRIFLEEAEFDVNITDQPDIKMAKEKLTTLKNQLTEYKTKKPLIDTAYLTIKIDADLQKKIESIVGKIDALPGQDRNPFLVEYLHIASLTRKVNNIQIDTSNDKVKKDDFSEELKLSTDDTTKKSVSAKITDITNRISTNTANMASLVKDIADAQKSLDDKMKSIEKNMMDNIKKLSDQTSK
jgi:DNA-directed RNA polymerase subunit L